MPNRLRSLARRCSLTLALFIGAAVCGCGGGGGGSPAAAPAAPAATPTPVPTPTPGGPPAISTASATFSLAGQTSTVVVSEPGYGGSIGADASACTNIASVSPATASAPATFTITAVGSGSCTLGFVDGFGQRATVQVGVTVTRGSIN